MRILVTDSGTRAGLAAIRTLGRAGHEVVVAGATHPSLGSVSRYASAVETYPEPALHAEAFIEALAAIATRRSIDVLLPMTEITTLLATAHRHRLPATCRMPFPGTEIVARASHKGEVLALARELGVPVPESISVPALDAAAGVATELARKNMGWPVVIKPARSRVRIGDGWHSTSVAYAHDAAALIRILESIRPELYPVLVQQRIEGPGAGLFACMQDGRAVGQFAHRRLREKPPSGGVSVLCESVAADPDLVRYSTLLLAALGWRGPAMVEFKRDARTGVPHLMEINGRFWGSLQLAIESGVDFPVLAVAVALEQPLPEPPSYRTGVRSRWLGGDLDTLLLQLTRSRRSLDLPPGHVGRLGALWRFLSTGGRLELEQGDDPAPARLEWRKRLGLRG